MEHLISKYGITVVSYIPASSGADLGPVFDGVPGGNEGFATCRVIQTSRIHVNHNPTARQWKAPLQNSRVNGTKEIGLRFVGGFRPTVFMSLCIPCYSSSTFLKLLCPAHKIRHTYHTT